MGKDMDMNTDTTTLSVAATLIAAPEVVFDILMSSKKHSALTGAESSIDGRVGGKFSYFGGAVSGVLDEVEPNERIVQKLRAQGWPDGHYASVTYELTPLAEGQRTHVSVVEKGVPVDHLDEVVAGWRGYWEAFAVYLRESRVDVVRRFVEAYKNEHDTDIVDELIAADCVVHIPLPGLPQGREGMRVNGKLVCAAFPDVHVTREFMVSEGDIVVERASAKATHQGELLGTAPTGNDVSWTELHAYRVQGDEITEVWTEADFMGMLVDIGAVRRPGDTKGA